MKDKSDCTVQHEDRIRFARNAMPPELELLDAGELLKALADGTRIRLVAALLETEMCVCDLATLMGMSQSAVSHQLRILRQNRLVSSRRAGKNTYYRLDDDHISSIVGTALQHIRETYRSQPEGGSGHAGS